jgi:hypothetical protein
MLGTAQLGVDWDQERERAMRLKNVLIAAGIAGSLLVGSSARAAIIVSNYSFETPSESSQTYLFEYSPTIAEQGGAGWTGSGWGIAENGGFGTNGQNNDTGSLQNSPNGVQAGLLQHGSYIEQTISGITPGSSYSVSFFAEGRNFASGANPLQVSLGGSLLTFGVLGNTITPPVGTTFTAYTSDPITLAASSNVLEFTGLNPGGGDQTSFIDAVSVNSVPEPASLSLIALCGIVLLARRRRF